MAATQGDEIHQAVIRDHFRRPRNRGSLDPPATSGHAHNPFCGDTVRVWVRVEDGRIAAVSFDGRGCSISQAAASMLTVLVKGLEVDALAGLRRAFADGLTTDGPPLPRRLGDLRALAGVRRFPSRVRCAVLPFDALRGSAGGMREEPPCFRLTAIPARPRHCQMSGDSLNARSQLKQPVDKSGRCDLTA